MNEKHMLEQMYWQQGLSLPQIAQKLGWSYSKTYQQFRIKHQIDTHKSIWDNLKIEEPKLRLCLNNKYSMMVRLAIQRQGEQVRYFSSSEEAGRLYNCRPGDFREVLRNGKYNRQNVTISRINIDELLEHHNCTDLQEYYNRCLI